MRGPALGAARADAPAILAAAAGRSLVAVVRDAHRDQNTRSLVEALLVARPDLVLVEMGLPLWRPPEGTSYMATLRCVPGQRPGRRGTARAGLTACFHDREDLYPAGGGKPFAIMQGQRWAGLRLGGGGAGLRSAGG